MSFILLSLSITIVHGVSIPLTHPPYIVSLLQRSTLHCVLCCTGVQRGGGAVQLDSDDARLHGLHRLRLHGGQRGSLRHMRQETRHRAPHLRQPQPHHRPGALPRQPGVGRVVWRLLIKH